jgi:hypothetical protein
MIEGGLSQPGSARRMRSARRRKRRILGLVALALLAGAAYDGRNVLELGRDLLEPAGEPPELGPETTPEPEAAPPAPPVPPEPAPTPEASAPAAEPLPPLGESDAFVRELAARLSARPEWARWLAGEGLVHRFVAAVDSVANGASPRDSLRELVPEAAFRASERGGQTFVDPASWSRYDLVTALFTSLDAQGCARVYRELLPLFETAHDELARSEGSFEATLARAFRELLRAPVRDGEIALVPGVRSYDFADPELEALSPAQKQLLRLGPTNARRVQAKLRELAAALGLDVAPGRGRS